MNFGAGAPGGTVRCRYCSASLPVMPGLRAIQCPQCNCVTRVRRPRPWLPSPAVPMHVAGGGFFPHARGKKRAVLIGITYAGMRRGGRGMALRAPVNDVKCMRYLLCERFGFPNDCVQILTDEEKDPCRLATKENIRMAMNWLVQGCSYGDSLVFHFSGLGAQVPDENGDELDGYDEAICPMDSFQQGPILDDEINEAIVRPLVHGAKLHAVVDAQHSSTVLDLPFLCRLSRNGTWQWKDNRPPTGAYKGTSGGQAMLFSGCSDGENNISLLPEASTVGAMTHSFIKAVECEPGATYGRLLTSMRAIMREGGVNCYLQGPIGAPIRKVANFSGVQEPNLSCSERFDIYRKPFVL
ncbi:hypothetical protein E2562_012360 [Oryza meyeriana var. granulata]|uniref:Peptidase C14 caspase domain-containing protein n=1 Tax=Oryza meyeriana var. granulata TaxID=110450 RepID=A0A6G1DHI2_9ORYZ|nr:hypothetical protein E2562_012360 [Oryza meyeriana var. granulata]